uniref:Uncharacterized protein n=1 Tax=Paracoccus marcusii TaxID=59779 RepID=I6UJF1_9RHOB|nr:hypothetical protein [Paracoccus marcusii]
MPTAPLFRGQQGELVNLRRFKKQFFCLVHQCGGNLAVKMGLPILLCVERIEDRVRTGTFLDRIPGQSARLSLNERQCRGQEIATSRSFPGLAFSGTYRASLGINDSSSETDRYYSAK